MSYLDNPEKCSAMCIFGPSSRSKLHGLHHTISAGQFICYHCLYTPTDVSCFASNDIRTPSS